GVMGRLVALDLTAAGLEGQPGKEGLAVSLGVATGKIQQGFMLTLSDGADTHAAASHAPREVASQVAETLTEKGLRVTKGLFVTEAKLQNTVSASVSSVRSRLSAGTDVNALVQAVLRECYL